MRKQTFVGWMCLPRQGIAFACFTRCIAGRGLLVRCPTAQQAGFCPDCLYLSPALKGADAAAVLLTGNPLRFHS